MRPSSNYWLTTRLTNYADIAQLVERESSKLNVVGSMPTVRSISGVSVHHRPCAIEGTIGRDVLPRINSVVVQREHSVRLHAGRSRAGTTEMELVEKLVERSTVRTNTEAGLQAG